MHRLTEQQVQRLTYAIDNASGHGSLQYIVDGKPACVVAHLAAVEGVADSVMKRWDDSAFVVLSKPNSPLKSYPIALLQYLQFLWDDTGRTADMARGCMRKMVELAASEQFDTVDAYAEKLGLPKIGLNN